MTLRSPILAIPIPLRVRAAAIDVSARGMPVIAGESRAVQHLLQ